MFFTRIPVKKDLSFQKPSELLSHAARFFPWIGLLIGCMGALTLWISAFFFPLTVAVLISMLTTLLITGAFHEDGLADCCDAFGGGWSKPQILSIMKDSRLGSYGVIGLWFILSLKWVASYEIARVAGWESLAFCLIAAHALSRFTAITLLQQYTYVRDTDQSKSKPLANHRLSFTELSIAAMGGLPALVYLNYKAIFILIPQFIVRCIVGRYFFKWIGGYTGDCLGCCQQIAEVVFYLSFLIIWKYI